MNRLHLPSGSYSLNISMILLLLAASVLAAGQEKTLYRFKGGTDGKYPAGGVIADKNGNLYGTTMDGGNGNACTCGTVFEFSPRKGGGGKETVLYSFQGGSNNGSTPKANLVFDQAGNLYGTTVSGGSLNHGIVFQLTPPLQEGGAWTEIVLYSFTYNNGLVSPSSLVIDPAGNLYGENPGDENSTDGYVYELTPSTKGGGAWTYSVLYSFQGFLHHDGSTPTGALLLDKSGNLYGTTAFGGEDVYEYPCDGSGCGTVFELKHPAKQGDAWTEKVLYRFTNKPDGAEPLGGVSWGRNGNSLYGTTSLGGSQSLGTVFQLSPPSKQGGAWTETILSNFLTSGATLPNSRVVFDRAGNLYGTTVAGQYKSSGGVFELSPPAQQGDPWTETTLYAGPPGATTTSGVILNKSDNTLFGALSNTGKYGVLFKVTLP